MDTIQTKMMQMKDPIPVMPKVSVSTPIGSIEADYGNPILDGLVIVFVIGSLYIIKKMVDNWRGGKK